jgi:hypothetical protein
MLGRKCTVLESKVEELKAKHAYFETVAARLEALELRNNHSIQITAGKACHLLLQGNRKFAVICSADDPRRDRAKDG